MSQLDLFDMTTTPIGRGIADAESKLPKLALEIYGLVGLDSLTRVIARWGGTHMDFPAHQSNIERSVIVQQLADEIGWADAKKIAVHFQGVRFHVPQCAAAVRHIRNTQIRADLDAGISAAVVARKYKMSERNVWLVAKTV